MSSQGTSVSRRGSARCGFTSISNLSRKAFGGLLVLALFSVAPAFAQTTWTVTSLGDDAGGPATLREAIAAAAPGDTIDFSITGTITLNGTLGQLTIAKDLTITGPGAASLAVSGDGRSRVFNIEADATVNISGLTIRDGFASRGGSGGGININNNGTLALNNSTISGNTSASGRGGGIFNEGTLTLTNSTVSGNSTPGSSSSGGGIANDGTLTLTNSTVSGNFAAGNISLSDGGGGIANSGGTLTLTNSTVSGNSASSFFDSIGGIFNNGGTLDVKNTIVANNFPGVNCSTDDGFGTATSFGHNLSNDDSCYFFSIGLGDLIFRPGDHVLGPLQDNGGPTETHAVRRSPAKDRIPLADCTAVDGTTPITTDQRGVARPQGSACDIGAFESQSDIDVEGPITSYVVSSSNPLPVFTNWILTATVSDATTGNNNIGSAEHQIDGGTFSAMNAQDGAFDEVTEDVSVSLPAFESAGVYEICVRGTDALSNVGEIECILLPVYDPGAGFVTGGGWINSPAGASTAFPDAVGKATFGFVSKYKRGATIPTGQTEFQFKAGDLDFESTEYQWLVVSGPLAQYKGSGTINGSGDYGFLLRATDGAVNGSGPDKFRIMIWDKETEATVYDNGTDQEIVGGSIVIHAK